MSGRWERKREVGRAINWLVGWLDAWLCIILVALNIIFISIAMYRFDVIGFDIRRELGMEEEKKIQI